MKWPILSAALDVLSVTIQGSINLTVNHNSQDLSPNFASSIYGIMNFTGSMAGFSTFYILPMFMDLNVIIMQGNNRVLILIYSFCVFVLGVKIERLD